MQWRPRQNCNTSFYNNSLAPRTGAKWLFDFIAVFSAHPELVAAFALVLTGVA